MQRAQKKKYQQHPPHILKGQDQDLPPISPDMRRIFIILHHQHLLERKVEVPMYQLLEQGEELEKEHRRIRVRLS